MCFSAEASFGASIVIGGIGIVALKKAQTHSQQVFAMIPVFFALQQFTEGLIWLDLLSHTNTPFSPWLSIKTKLYLLFAWMIWPSFIPYSFSLLEENFKRKKILKLFTVVGVLVSLVLSYILIFQNITPKISNYHIKYEIDFVHRLAWVLGILYVLSTVFSCFVSSVKGVWSLGVINLSSYIISKLVFEEYVLSVWCYFAALSSVIVLVIILKQVKKENIAPLVQTYK